MRRFLQWEQYEINALMESIEIKAKVERKKVKTLKKLEEDRKDLQKLSNG